MQSGTRFERGLRYRGHGQTGRVRRPVRRNTNRSVFVTISNQGRPAESEQIAYFGQYIDLVPDGDIVEILTRQIGETMEFFEALSPMQAQWRPAVGEWSTVEIAGHLGDTERV